MMEWEAIPLLTAHDLPFPVTALRPVTGGHLHRTYRAESPDGPLFLKLYTGPDWPLEQVAETLRVQQHLVEASHPVPRVVRPATALSAGVLVAMAFLPGARIDQPGPVPARAAGVALGRIHRDLGSLPVTVAPFRPEAEPIRERARHLLEAVRAAGRLDAMDNLAVEAAQYRLVWLEHHPIDPAVYAGATAQWVHGDYYPGNLLYTAPDVISGIIDFDFASVRYRGLEMARAVVECALRPDGRFDRETAAAFLTGYLTEHPLNADERQSGFRIWLEYLLFSLYPLPLRYKGGAMPHGWERLAQRRHELMRFLGDHLSELEQLVATI